MGPSESTDAQGPTTRCDDHLKQAKELLIQWRYNTWLLCYSNAVPFGPLVLLPDPILEKVAYRRFVCHNDLHSIGWSESRACRHAEDVWKQLRELDVRMDSEKNAVKAQRAAAKKQEMVERKVAKHAKAKAEQAPKKEEKELKPLSPLLHCSLRPYPSTILATSEAQNLFSPLTPSHVAPRSAFGHLEPTVKHEDTEYSVSAMESQLMLPQLSMGLPTGTVNSDSFCPLY